MRRAAFTLLELVIAITILGIIGLIGGRLLVSSMDRWQQDAQQRATETTANATLRALGEDLQSQINLLDWPDPFTGDPTPEILAAPLALFSYPMGRDGPVAVVWLLEEESLWRIEAAATETLAALPENAASASFALAREEEESLATALQSLNARRMASRVQSVEIHRQDEAFLLILELAYPGEGADTYTARMQTPLMW